jgi:hypothetical protein
MMLLLAGSAAHAVMCIPVVLATLVLALGAGGVRSLVTRTLLATFLLIGGAYIIYWKEPPARIQPWGIPSNER